MNARLLSFCFLLACLFSFATAQARILNVPQDYQTIQAGINTSQDGDTVLLQPGVYHENIIIHGINPVIGSLILMTGDSAYTDSTIIDGQGQGSTFFLELQDSTHLRGFTITNGSGTSMYRTGGGIYGDGSPILEDLHITENNGGIGGGIYMSDASPILRNVRIDANVAQNGGGGIFTGGRPELYNCIISGNEAESVGGLEFVDCDPILRHVAVIDNRAMGQPDGMIGGIYLLGGGIQRPIIFDQVTIARNRSVERRWGCGIQMTAIGLGLELSNSIIRDNNEVHEIVLKDGVDGEEACRLFVGYSDIRGGENAISVEGISELTWLDGNINADPLFVDPDHGDYHLTANSPCIDTGDPDSPLDPDSTRADMGAFYYFHQTPDIVIQPRDLTFPMLGWGELDSLPVEISNQGGIALHITRIATPNFLTCVFVRLEGVFDPPLEIAPDSSMTLWVYIQPDSGAQFIQTDINIASDDPDEPEVSVTAHGEWPNRVSDPQLSIFSLQLSPAFPNPFNSKTTISFDLPWNSPVSVRVFDLSGRSVATLVNGQMTAGSHTVIWNGAVASTGIYLVRMESGSFSAVRKIALVK